MQIPKVTPKIVAEFFRGLSPEEQQACLGLFDLTAEGAFLLIGQMRLTEQKRFSEILFEQHTVQMLPWIIQHAISVAKDHPGATNEEMELFVNEATKRSVEEYQTAHIELAKEQFKEERDRKSDPETIRRNVEICDRRKRDPKTWSYRKLAKEYDMRWQSIQRIIAEETKWRRLAGDS
jgi:hypothetical protein